MYTTSGRTLTSLSLTRWRTGTPEDRADLAHQLDQAGRDPGVFLLTDVGLPQSLEEEVAAATRQFFALPTADKQALRDPDDQFLGYRGSDNRNDLGFADSKETFHIGPHSAATLLPHGPAGAPPPDRLPSVEEALAGSRLWPGALPDFVIAWHRWYRAMQELALDLLEMFAAALDVPVALLHAFGADNAADLAANFYPQPPPGAATAIRNAAHSDLTFFTILFQDGGEDGLLAQWRDGTWLPVPAGGGRLVVNFGELAEMLTSGRWRAVPHQVAPVEAGTPDDRARVTIPLFYRPASTTALTPLPSPVATGGPGPLMGDWLVRRKSNIPDVAETSTETGQEQR